MGRFFLRVISFISLPVLLIFTVEIYISCNKQKIFSEEKLDKVFQKTYIDYNWINHIKKDSLAFLTGSSSVKYGLSCIVLNNLSGNNTGYVNLALDARDPIETYFILKHLDLKRVKSVYFGLDPWIFTKNYYKHRNSYLYLDFGFLKMLKYCSEQDETALVWRYISLIRSFIKTKSPKEDITFEKIPYDFGSVALDKIPINFNIDIADLFKIEKYGWSELQFEYLNKIALLLNYRNISFTLFVPPKRSDFSGNYRTKCAETHKEFVSVLEKSAIKNANIVGTFDKLEEIGDSIFFAEAFHLNKKGQTMFSKIFYGMITNEKKTFSSDYPWFSYGQFKQ